MKHKNLLAMIASVGLLGMGLTCQTAWAQGQGGNAPAHVPGRILVKFKDGVSEGQARGLLAGRGALSTDVIPQIGVHVIQLSPNANEQAEANAFKGLAEVEFAELDRVSLPQGLTAMTPNDAYYSGQWALPKIQANYAWSTTTGNSNIKIAVIDTGVTAVSDLTNKLVAGWNFYDGNSNTTDVANHGTLVAGVAAPLTNNGIGVAGVCWGCTIMPLRVSDTSGQGYAYLAANALTWAADNGAKVAIVGYPFTAVSSVQTAAQYFFSKGGVVLIPMGNSTTFDTTPMPLITGTSVPSMMAVSATDPNDQIYTWSTVGYDVALAAPGAVTTTTMTDGFYTTLAQGTSYSAAEVGGVAALMLSVNSCLSPTQVTNILLQTAVDLGPAGWDATYGWGRVNANQAVMTASTTACTGGGGGPPPAPVVTGSGGTGTVGTFFSYQIVATNSPTTYNATGLPAGLGINTTTGVISGTPTVAGGPYSVGLSATNSGGTGTGTLTLTINPAAVAAPVVTSSNTTGTVGTSFGYQITATNSPTSYGASGLPSGLTLNSTTGVISGTPSVAGGPYSVGLSATNSGGTGTGTLTLTINSNAPPKPAITSAMSATGTQNSAFGYQITATNSPTSYGASGLPTGLSVNTSTGMISGTPTVSGTFNVTVSATNSGGTGSATPSFTITTAAPPPTPVITSSLSATGAQNTGFSYQITATNSPTTFGASGLPSGLAVDTSSGWISGTPTGSGTFYVTISATNSGGTGSATLVLTINPGAPPPVDFSISASPSNANVKVGNSANYTVNVTAINGFSGTVSLSVAGATGSFNPPTVIGSGSTVLSVSAPRGSYFLTITAASGGLVHSTSVTLRVH